MLVKVLLVLPGHKRIFKLCFIIFLLFFVNLVQVVAVRFLHRKVKS